MSRWIEPVTLKGEHVTLEPLTAQHTQALASTWERTHASSAT